MIGEYQHNMHTIYNTQNQKISDPYYKRSTVLRNN